MAGKVRIKEKNSSILKDVFQKRVSGNTGQLLLFVSTHRQVFTASDQMIITYVPLAHSPTHHTLTKHYDLGIQHRTPDAEKDFCMTHVHLQAAT